MPPLHTCVLLVLAGVVAGLALWDITNGLFED